VKRLSLLHAALGMTLAICSCQPAAPEPKRPQLANLNYTLLGIWNQRPVAFDISRELREAGILSQLSGKAPTAVNVEGNKLDQAREIVAAHPEWAPYQVMLR